jgi:hypothetical protein
MLGPQSVADQEVLAREAIPAVRAKVSDAYGVTFTA